MKLLNAFSLNMLETTCPQQVNIAPLSVEEVRCLRAEHGLESAVGHADTAAVFADVLGIPVPMNRATVTLAAGERAVVGQYLGPRLSEGATELPPGAAIRWLLVEVLE